MSQPTIRLIDLPTPVAYVYPRMTREAYRRLQIAERELARTRQERAKQCLHPKKDDDTSLPF